VDGALDGSVRQLSKSPGRRFSRLTAAVPFPRVRISPPVLPAFIRDRDGSALVEGAILLPVLFVLLFGVYEFSWFFYQQHVVSTGLRDAARYVARLSGACDAASPLWPTEVAAARMLATTGSIAGGAPRVKGWTADMVTLSCAPIDNQVGPDGLSALRGGDVVYVVSAATRFTDPALGFFGLLGLRAPAISVSHSERVVGPG
jgi:TadE-like protein